VKLSTDCVHMSVYIVTKTDCTGFTFALLSTDLNVMKWSWIQEFGKISKDVVLISLPTLTYRDS
jgi:hypothetical protein